jgi:hypothetical protein
MADSKGSYLNGSSKQDHAEGEAVPYNPKKDAVYPRAFCRYSGPSRCPELGEEDWAFIAQPYLS